MPIFIFYTDCRYRQVRPKSLPECLQPFLAKLDEVKEDGHDVSGHAMIRSLPGCAKQDYHYDYLSMRGNGKVTGVVCPYSILLALENDSYVYVNGEKLPLPIATAIIMRGDVLHSGSEYDTDNMRLHIYMDVVGFHVAKEGKDVKWY